MRITQVRHEPFARATLERTKAQNLTPTGPCAECGQDGKWRYRWVKDGYGARPENWSRPFCSIKCYREYTDIRG